MYTLTITFLVICNIVQFGCLRLLEFYGEKMKLDQFSLVPREIISDNWIVI